MGKEREGDWQGDWPGGNCGTQLQARSTRALAQA